MTSSYEPKESVPLVEGNKPPESSAIETEGLDARAEFTDTLMAAIRRELQSEKPENVRAYIELGVKLVEATGAIQARERIGEERHHAGMWLGAFMATASAIGGAAAGVNIHVPAIISITLLCLAAACAGGTFAIIAAGEARSDNDQNSLAALSQLELPTSQDEKET